MTASSGTGSEVVCNAEVTKITVEHGRAIGVQVHDQFVRARRAVLADVAAKHLYGRLVTFDELPPKVRARMAGFAGTLGRQGRLCAQGSSAVERAAAVTSPEPFMSATPMKSWSSASPS